jgi:hypothetical protein
MFEVNGRFKMVLSVMSVLAGTLVALITVALLWREKVYIDTKTKQITKIDLPFGIKLQTNAPLIAIVFMAAGLILVPVMKHREQNGCSEGACTHARRIFEGVRDCSSAGNKW